MIDEGGTTTERRRSVDFKNVLKRSLDKRDHHIIDEYPRNPDNQVRVDVQHAVLCVTVAASPDSGAEAHRPRRLSILEDVTRLHLLELDLEKARELIFDRSCIRRKVPWNWTSCRTPRSLKLIRIAVLASERSNFPCTQERTQQKGPITPL